MSLPEYGRVVIIDDNIKEVEALIKVLSKHRTSITYFTGANNELPDTPFPDVRIVFLDVVLEGLTGKDTKTIVSTLIGILGKIVDKNKDAPFEHPSGNTIFAYDYDGNLLWKWRVDGYAGECALNDRYLVIPLAQNLVTEDRSGHGVYVFDVSERGGASSRLIQTYNTEGITVSADISPDGRYIAALEAPSRLEDGTVLGEYKVHILT
jgi:hypothetical protein